MSQPRRDRTVIAIPGSQPLAVHSAAAGYLRRVLVQETIDLGMTNEQAGSYIADEIAAAGNAALETERAGYEAELAEEE